MKNTLSNFYIEVKYDFIQEPIIMNIIVDTPANINPITFKLHSSKIDSNDNRNLHLYTLLFGNKKSSDWLHNFLYKLPGNFLI